ncbi:MAG: DNA-binding protein, partial [Bacteroidia bacterium]|nr:DNA-binding protein [Bacteroidia bacterium]
SIYYDSIVDHLVTATGATEAKILGVIYTPA